MTSPQPRFDDPLDRCRLCGSRDIAPFHQDHKGIAILRCGACGVQFMNPQYTDEYLAEYYGQYVKDEPEWDAPRRTMVGFYLDLIEGLADDTRGGGTGERDAAGDREPRRQGRPRSLLDIGCGKGLLLDEAVLRGMTAVGYDVDPETTRWVAQRSGCEVLSGDFAAIDWSGRTFDIITMHHVLEHLKDPLVYLDAIDRILAPSGILFIALPNLDSISARWKLFLERRGLRRRNVGAYYDTDHHVFYFTPATLTRLLEGRGFEVLHRRSCHSVDPGQPDWQLRLARNTSERGLWKSGFLVIARRANAGSS